MTEAARRRPRFSSHLATLLTMAGLAIGLGNVWRFPYMMGQNGGSAFLALYLVFMVILAVPALAAEWALGRATTGGPVRAFRTAFGDRAGLLIGIVLLFSVFMAMAYYSLVIGNVLFSAWHGLVHGFSGPGMARYHAGLEQRALQYGFGLAVIAASAWVAVHGLRGGIERANRLLVPAFGVVSLYLVVVALRLETAPERLLEFLRPDFARITPAVLFAAMGQACFSVGLSGVLAVTYGGYLARHETLASTALTTGLMDTGAALLATAFVVPAVLVFGLDMAAGPRLMFDTLPHLFAVMPGGRGLAPVFLAGWAMVSVLTLMATLDAVASGLADLLGKRWPRQRAIWLISAALAIVMAPVAIWPAAIGTLDLVFGSGMFMVGALLAALGVGWGLGRGVLLQQLGAESRAGRVLAAWIRWVIPAALAAILGGFLWTTLAR